MTLYYPPFSKPGPKDPGDIIRLLFLSLSLPVSTAYVSRGSNPRGAKFQCVRAWFAGGLDNDFVGNSRSRHLSRAYKTRSRPGPVWTLMSTN